MIAIIGGGKMGEALLAGLLATGYEPTQVLVTEPHPDRAAELRERYGVAAAPLADSAARASTLVLAVKPQDMVEVLDDLSPHLKPDCLVVSIAAGITTALLEKHLPADTPVVRAMPNTPALVGKGMTAVAAGSHTGDAQLDHAESLLRSVGDVVRVPEHHMDTVTALSGSGPAYFYFIAETMIEAGVAMGMTRAAARKLVTQTITGAAEMLADPANHPVVLREAVTSPGGTTAAAVRELERHGVRTAFTEAIEAARDRSRRLSEG
ncbi:pyrroline-5-carboxylate reductase [Streptomonospora nanhaiensis]|uniref:Pyrroline-5-carboxylate reductase n=1 Tax=Streptomonospora nanhaiensis TaxID=1323731 RepID=A0A853BME9_9ACTN|nr:pyrroline-5-carboxylate reductase [Streptomonospora nanhaiensis]MBV2361778.1 pyrroline-5-carboxylate reductase [Streptomonospora nanhaiensis]MBX9388010.1 pyrroline-5-carboxylate reductase [Streptomonospora nanhaiensis]NYI96403.1 pyrroline-5-carboxylate reductase [Streptomonospora nanhaiensis]